MTMTLGWSDDDREQVRRERLAAERAWLEERRWCRCGKHGRPGRTYGGERTCERCGSPWRRPEAVRVKAEPKVIAPRLHRCGDSGGVNKHGEACRVYTVQGMRCDSHREVA